jgi:DsbC/DsbD-like thiol-disulfide interchange protein
MKKLVIGLWLAGMLSAGAAWADDWTTPVEVRHEQQPCISYRARLSGDSLAVRVSLAPGWHTFSIDNERRALEKLAGKQNLGVERPTSIKLSGGIEAAGPWHQTPPKDFSKPELNWFSYGYENQAMFASKVRLTGPGPALIAIRGQACTESTCKNIDAVISLPLTGANRGTAIDWKSLIPVR